MGGTGGTTPLRRNHDFMLLWTGETVSQLGSSMSFFVFPLLGYSLTGSTTQAALAGGAFTLGQVVTRLPAGVLVDRWNRRTVMVAVSASGGLLYASLGLAHLLGGLTLAHLVLVALLTGATAAFFDPAETAALRAVVPAAQLPDAFSQNQARQHLAALVGPPLGGALFSLRAWAPFAFDSVTYLVSALTLTRLRTPLPPPPRADAESSPWQDTLEGLRFLMGKGFLRAILAFAALANFAGSALFLVLTLKLLQAGVAPAAIGLIDTIGAVAGIVGAVLAPWVIRRVPSGPLALTCSALIAVAVVPMAFTNDVLVIGCLLALALLGNPSANACIRSYLVATTPDRLMGRASAALGFSATLLTPLAPVTGGALMAVWGGRNAMLAAAGLTVVSVLPLLLSKDVRTLPTPDRWPNVGTEAVETAA